MCAQKELQGGWSSSAESESEHQRSEDQEGQKTGGFGGQDNEDVGLFLNERKSGRFGSGRQLIGVKCAKQDHLSKSLYLPFTEKQNCNFLPISDLLVNHNRSMRRNHGEINDLLKIYNVPVPCNKGIQRMAKSPRPSFQTHPFCS